MAQQYVIACYAAGEAPASDVAVEVSSAGVACSGVVDGSGSQGFAYLEPAGSISSDVPVSGGAEAGTLIGGAVFMVLAVAFGLRTLRRFLESSSEG
ncbi:MAG TPA: major capsid protein [Paraburkholderia sp.]|jgi:hypothetical protein|nr:major capsid protein [Paraburkholderia sp.]